MKIKCSVIILSYNTKAITEVCLNKLKSATDHYEKIKSGNVEVIVVDNASLDGSPELIKSKFPWVKLITNKINTGFAKANNQAMKVAKGDYFLLLNSDAYIEKDTIIKAEEYLVSSNADVISCKLTYKDHSFQPSGGYLPTPINSALWMLGIEKLPIFDMLLHPVHPSNPNFFKKNRSIEWIMGAFMFMKREVFEKTKGFDEKFFLYMEEVEWCKRIKDKRFVVKYTPTFSIIHLGRASSNFDVAKPLVMEAQGLLYFTKKHYPNSYSFVKIAIKFGSLMRIILFLLLGQSKRALAYKTIFTL